MLDEFREWLSDNLRYFMLGGGILIVVAVLFFGIRACAGGKKSGDNGETTTKESAEGSADTGEEGEKGETATNPLQAAGDDVVSLIKKYYEAMGSKDINALESIEANFDEEESDRVVNSNDYIEEYRVKDVYTKNGLSEGSYVVYVSFEYKCKDIETLVPALSQLYVITDENGDLKIDASGDSTITNYVNQLKNDDDVDALTRQIRDAYEQVQKDDPDLAAFLNELGTDDTESGEESSSDGTTMTVNASSVNVRSQPSTDGYILGAFVQGTTVEPLGEEDGWIQVDYYGQTGYIYSEYLD